MRASNVQPTSHSSATGLLTKSDAHVIASVLGGREANFEILMRRHNERVYRTARAILRDEHDVEDVMQQAWVSAYKGLPNFQGNATFATWLTRITVNEALTRRRQRLRQDRQTSQDPAWIEDRTNVAAPVSDPLGTSELQSIVMAAVERLPAPLRIVFVLRAIQGLDSRETAKSLGIANTLARVRYHRARAKLRKALTSRADAELAQTFRFYIPRCDKVVGGVLATLDISPDPAIRAGVLALLESM